MIMVAALLAYRRGRDRTQVLVALLLPIAAVLAWAAFTWVEYGVFEGSRAFIDYTHFRPRGTGLLTFSLRWDVLGATLLMEAQPRGANWWVLVAILFALPLIGFGLLEAWKRCPLLVAQIVIGVVGMAIVTVTAFYEGLIFGVLSRLVLPGLALLAVAIGIGATDRRVPQWVVPGLAISSTAAAWWYFLQPLPR